MRSPHVFGAALAALSASCIVQPPPGYVSSASAGLEVNIDRPGGDYRSFELASGRPEECRDTCMTEPQCAAFTFMSPGVQGPGARCWLKSTVPNQSPNACCISGVKSAAPPIADEVPPSAVEQAPPPVVEQAPPPFETPPPAQPQWVGAPPPPQQPQWVGAPPPPREPQWVGSPPPAGPQWVGAPAEDLAGLERDVDRPGADYTNFELGEARPRLCAEACRADGRCRAFTYARPGARGPKPHCWLKDRVPRAQPSDCCVSGVKVDVAAAPPPPAPSPPRRFERGPFEPNADRRGADYRSFDLTDPRPELCRDACMREGQCLSFTYLRPNVRGPVARCWLKAGVPPAVPDNCCISGVK